MSHFLKRNKEKCLQISLSKSRYYNPQFLRYRAKHTKIGNSLFALLPPKNPKIKIWKHEKIYGRYHFQHVYQKSQSYDVWFLRHRVRQTEFFVILDYFLPPPHTNDPENQNFEKKTEKKCLEILSFHTYMCTINEDHMMYGS